MKKQQRMLAISRRLNAALLCQEYLEYVCFLDILDFHDVQEHQGQGSTASLDSCLLTTHPSLFCHVIHVSKVSEWESLL